MHNQLEDYLAQVAAQLAPLPLAHRDDELNELRQHLLNAVAVCRKQGLSEGTAARTALEQFGEPESVGLEIAHTWRRGEKLKKRSFWGAAVTTFLLSTTFLLCWILTLFMNIFLRWFMDTHGSQVFNEWAQKGFWLVWSLSDATLVGCLCGLAFPKWAVSGTASGFAFGCLSGSILAFYAIRVVPSHVSLNLPLMISGQILNALVIVMCAGLISRWRRNYHSRLARS